MTAPRFIGGAFAGGIESLVRSFDELDASDFMETYERFEDNELARELANACGSELDDEGLS